jgi:hypothetical protein
MAKSPVSIPFTTDGVEVGVKDGLAVPANARGFISVGVDGSGNTQFLLVDTNGRISTVGAAAVGAALSGNPLLVGASDGTNVQVPRVFDTDSGVGTEYVLGVALRKTASGGSVELGTSTDPVRVDPTGTTTQPVSVADLETTGTREALAVSYPEMLKLMERMSAQLDRISAQLATITEEEDPL